MIVVPFEPGHIRQIRAQPAQRDYELGAEAMDTPFGYARTAMHNGRPLACAGVVEVWQGRAYAWALLAEDAGPFMLPITRAIRSVLDGAPFRRVEMAVDADFAAGRRWAELLGFDCETPRPMPAYLPNGRPAFLYARVKHGTGNDDRHHGDAVRREHLSRGSGRGAAQQCC